MKLIAKLISFVWVAVVALAGASSHSIAQDAKFRTGTLTCKGRGGIGLIIGSKERLDCSYKPSGNRPSRRFRGTITRIGLDIGVKGKSVIIWAVLGSTSALPSEALGGTFVGVAADASLGLGAGAQVLVGGNKKSVTLQPLSVKAQTGINLAIGVSGLKLVPLR
ncbi:MAG: DUF992 domain-containing protein [Hyphomicrobiaceae bacterium]